MAKENLATAVISVTTLKRDLSRKLEPRTSVPPVRMDTIKELAEAGIPVCVNVAPIIPGLTDEEIPAILREASERGAKFTGTSCLDFHTLLSNYLLIGWKEIILKKSQRSSIEFMK
jgi:DNA repair photolyase